MARVSLLKWLLGGAGGIAAANALIWSRRPVLTRVRVPLPGLPPPLSGLRVVQISDLHLGPFFGVRHLRHVIALAGALSPDVVALTGDFVGHRSLACLEAHAGELAALRAPRGIYACLGNHDHWEGAQRVTAALERAGVRVLINTAVSLDARLWIVGVDDLMSGRPDLERAVAGVPMGAGVLLLSHNPTILPRVADRPWLVLSGHTHGGQVALPLLGPRRTMLLPGIRTLVRLYEGAGCRIHQGRLDAVATYRYPAGWFDAGRARLYVSRGVGVGEALPARFFCPPEIVCFTLVQGNAPS